MRQHSAPPHTTAEACERLHAALLAVWIELTWPAARLLGWCVLRREVTLAEHARDVRAYYGRETADKVGEDE